MNVKLVKRMNRFANWPPKWWKEKLRHTRNFFTLRRDSWMRSMRWSNWEDLKKIWRKMCSSTKNKTIKSSLTQRGTWVSTLNASHSSLTVYFSYSRITKSSQKISKDRLSSNMIRYSQRFNRLLREKWWWYQLISWFQSSPLEPKKGQKRRHSPKRLQWLTGLAHKDSKQWTKGSNPSKNLKYPAENTSEPTSWQLSATTDPIPSPF